MERLKWIYRAWRYRLKVEKQEIRSLFQHLDAGDTAVDIGAHKGAFTYWMRRCVGKSGTVYAFEPQPDLAGKLRQLAESSGFTNIVIENMGLSSKKGTLNLKVPGMKASPSASFEDTEDTQFPGQSFPVEVTTLDQYFSGKSCGNIRLIKCDAEGHELEVFRGATQVLTTHHPYLLFECEARHRQGGSVEEVFEFLTDLGYLGSCLGRDGPFDIAGFDPAIHQSHIRDGDYINNFLFNWAGQKAE
jgi:FkbM family methyltransferase